MQNKACKTAPGCYPYELFPFLPPPAIRCGMNSQNMPRLSSPKPFCGTILGKKVRFNISVISLTVPVISYRLDCHPSCFPEKSPFRMFGKDYPFSVCDCIHNCAFPTSMNSAVMQIPV